MNSADVIAVLRQMATFRIRATLRPSISFFTTKMFPTALLADARNAA